MRGKKQKWLSTGLALVILSLPLHAYSQACNEPSSCSSNYRVDQSLFGSGGELDASSSNYRARQTVGELGVGNSASANYQAYAGFNTNDEPFIEFVVTGDDIDLGYLDTGVASTATGNFYIRAWLSDGYVVHTESDPPSSPQGHQLTPLAAPTTSSPGTEQFGINLRDNASPDIGLDPEQVPDNTFSFGQAATGYNAVDNFKYTKGDVIAHSTQSTSVTIYTISYLFNIAETTPSGQYTFQHVLVATATY